MADPVQNRLHICLIQPGIGALHCRSNPSSQYYVVDPVRHRILMWPLRSETEC